MYFSGTHHLTSCGTQVPATHPTAVDVDFRSFLARHVCLQPADESQSRTALLYVIYVLGSKLPLYRSIVGDMHQPKSRYLYTQ